MTHDELMIQTGEAMAAWHKDKTLEVEWMEIKVAEPMVWYSGVGYWDIGKYYYRIKPAPKVVPKVVPWTRETCPVGQVIRHRETGTRLPILWAGKDRFITEVHSMCLYSGADKHFTMDDGSPCGTVTP